MVFSLSERRSAFTEMKKPTVNFNFYVCILKNSFKFVQLLCSIRGPDLKPRYGFMVDSANYLSGVDQLSTSDSMDLVVKSKLCLQSGSNILKQLNLSCHAMGY